MNEEQKERIKELCIGGLLNDGGHHKQYFLEQILAEVVEPAKVVEQLRAEGYGEEDGSAWEPGIPP